MRREGLAVRAAPSARNQSAGQAARHRRHGLFFDALKRAPRSLFASGSICLSVYFASRCIRVSIYFFPLYFRASIRRCCQRAAAEPPCFAAHQLGMRSSTEHTTSRRDTPAFVWGSERDRLQTTRLNMAALKNVGGEAWRCPFLSPIAWMLDTDMGTLVPKYMGLSLSTALSSPISFVGFRPTTSLPTNVCFADADALFLGLVL